ncbi:hypothetical protein C8R45DRAFT_1114427 [Mycena sanguinolenta]|nr:hypothetical protein C8R45DRAFT_1114427 [Mycena sanguinolenta]
MANLSSATATPASRSDTNLEAIVALVSRLSVAASEATCLAIEVQAKLPLALAKHAATSITWIRSIAQTPSAVEAKFPAGSGEVWYVVIRGREPGLYRTPEEANTQTDGVPHQFCEKKKSRCEALAFYRDNYHAGIAYDNLVGIAYDNLVGAAAAAGSTPPPAVNMGVQKWVGLLAGTITPAVPQ